MLRKILVLLILIICFIGVIPLKSNAVVPINSAYIYANKRTNELLIWNGIKVHADIAVYKVDGKEYPAYCLNRGLPGADIGFSQEVDVNSLINNATVWRAIINGYPYKTVAELGCNTEEEAFLATKQAIYTILLDRDISEYSSAGGEAGERTLNAYKKIVNIARTSTEVKASPELKVNQENSLWNIDKLDNKYVSQEFSISANAGINSYNIKLENANIEGIKITDTDNNEKDNFNYNEKFKILIPITNILEDGNFTIKAFGKVATKPVFYGKSKDPALQNYALTGYTYEDGDGSKKIYYSKNDTKIIIIKKDKEIDKFLRDVEFNLLDKEKNVLYTQLKTDENGKIEINNLLPGIYYIEETRTLDGYELYDKLIEVDLELNETSTINVLNKEEEPNVEVKKINTENTVEKVKTNIPVKLPKTGM